MADWPKIHDYVKAHGIRCQTPPNVAQTTGGRHAKGSYHFPPKESAEDFGTVDSDPVAVAHLLRPLVDTHRGTLIVELLCDVNGADICVLSGRPQPWPDAALRQQHRNHCHVAIYAGATFPDPDPHPSGGTRPMFNPPLQLEAIAAACPWPGGGALLLSVNGGVYNFGGAPFFGAPEANALGENWARDGKKGASITADLDGHGYLIHSTDDGPNSTGYNYREPGH
jgi:hypothetical protein